MENTIPDFIVIDDDPVNNLICRKYIQIAYPGASIQTFTNPQAGLDYLLETYSTPVPNAAILFLDINMPILTGWDVLEQIDTFPETVKQQFSIYILSSSVSEEDRFMANANDLVSGFLVKPITIALLQTITTS